MRSTTLGGEIPKGCIPLCIVIIGMAIGAFIANEGAVNNNPLQMTAGLIIALGALVLGLGGFVKIDF